MPRVNKLPNLDSVICNLKWNVLGKDVFDKFKNTTNEKLQYNMWSQYIRRLNKQGRIKTYQANKWVAEYPKEWIDKNFY